MKFILSLIFLTSVFCSKAQQNTDRVTTYKNYGQYIQVPLRASHNFNYKNELAGLKEDYVFWLYFQIDTTGKIINLRDKHKANVPQLVVDYAYNLINRTSGQWNPEIKNCRVVVSDTITCQVEIIKNRNFGDFPDKPLEMIDQDYIIDTEDRKNICSLVLGYK